jgi:ribonucleoside-diphosphate reductase alpha chain
MCRRLNISYGSMACIDLIHSLGSTMSHVAKEYKQHTNNVKRKVLTLAPTGGTSSLVNASYSIEPYFHQAHKITPDQHILVQSVWQTYICNGVSKTVNVPEDASVAQIRTIYEMAASKGCKGITVYRDNCREWQPHEIK